jgi:hypothetical protein
MASELLWYGTPATCWQEGLPIGNGRIGAVIQSALHHEIWDLTEVTFWSGQAEQSSVNSANIVTQAEKFPSVPVPNFLNFLHIMEYVQNISRSQSFGPEHAV